MKQEQPILSCADREAVSIDAVLLNELLLSFTPDTIGIKQKASVISYSLDLIARGEYGDNSLEKFKEIITTEFLSVQLMEASSIARKEREKYMSDNF